ncbi:MAG TPA: NADH-quinone oxidoreductase subunit C [Syntrophomonadaceae bacterium]|nr:NADH-quinone oxidoreductase subunit C [Syntrophomonadaceae bacterium]
MKINAIKITPEEILATVQKYFDDGYRLVTATCVDEGEKIHLIYSFDRELALQNLELCISREQGVPSISSVYACAFLVENEMKELFGIKIDDIALDLGGRLYMVKGAEEAPMARKIEEAGEGVE